MGSSISICYVALNQGCWRDILFRDVLVETTDAQLAGGEGGEVFLSPFFKIENNVLIWDPNCVHLWVESIIQNVVLRVSIRKSSKFFPCETFFVVLLTRSLSKRPHSAKPPLPINISGCVPAQFYVIGYCVLILKQPWI